MSVDFGWFLPTMGDSEVIGPPTREPTSTTSSQVAEAAEDAGFTFALVPVGTTCQDAWLVLGCRRRAHSEAEVPRRDAPRLHRADGRREDVEHARPAHAGPRADQRRHRRLPGRARRRRRLHRARRALRPHAGVHAGRPQGLDRAEALGPRRQVLQDRGRPRLPASRTSKPCPPFYFGGASDAAKKVGAEETDVYLLWGEPLDDGPRAHRRDARARRCRRAHPALRPPHPRRRARDRRGSVGRRRRTRRRHPRELPADDGEAQDARSTPRAKSARSSYARARAKTSSSARTSGPASARRASASAPPSSAPARTSPAASRSTSTKASTPSSSPATPTAKKPSASANTSCPTSPASESKPERRRPNPSVLSSSKHRVDASEG